MRESLSDTHLKWFFLFGKYFTIPSQNSSGNRVFSSQTAKIVFHRFFPWFLGQRLLVFLSKIFCWLLGPMRLFFAMKTLERIASLFLLNFILQVTTSLFLENSWFVDKFTGLATEISWLSSALEIKQLVKNFSLHFTPCGSSFYF